MKKRKVIATIIALMMILAVLVPAITSMTNTAEGDRLEYQGATKGDRLEYQVKMPRVDRDMSTVSYRELSPTATEKVTGTVWRVTVAATVATFAFAAVTLMLTRKRRAENSKFRLTPVMIAQLATIDEDDEVNDW